MRTAFAVTPLLLLGSGEQHHEQAGRTRATQAADPDL